MSTRPLVRKRADMLNRGVALKAQNLVGAESYRLQFSMLLHFGLAIFLHFYNLLLSPVINTIARLFSTNVSRLMDASIVI